MGGIMRMLLGFMFIVGAVVGHADKEKKKENLTLYLDAEKRVKMEFVWIKPGKFMMGSPEDEKDRRSDEKRHEVTLTKGYWMQTTEVTQGQWEQVMGNNPSHFKGDPNRPVESVSWNDFQEFIGKVNEKCKGQLATAGTSTGSVQADLPTEAEWEYACRAGLTGRWCFGDDESKLAEYAWYCGNSDSKTHPVGQKKANEWGLYDMHGNVHECCKDWYGEYPEACTDPQGPPTGKYRVARGGGYQQIDFGVCCARRGARGIPTSQSDSIGGRLVLRQPKD